jgi:hypothetical protein
LEKRGPPGILQPSVKSLNEGCDLRKAERYLPGSRICFSCGFSLRRLNTLEIFPMPVRLSLQRYPNEEGRLASHTTWWRTYYCERGRNNHEAVLPRTPRLAPSRKRVRSFRSLPFQRRDRDSIADSPGKTRGLECTQAATARSRTTTKRPITPASPPPGASPPPAIPRRQATSSHWLACGSKPTT